MKKQKMTREQAEMQIAEKLKEIYEITKEYTGKNQPYITLCCINGSIMFQNHRKRRCLDYYKRLNKGDK